MAVTGPAWLALLADLPPVGDFSCVPMPSGPFAGWREARLILSAPPDGLRILTALLDPAGRASTISDLVALGDGQRQESLAARLEPDGQVTGTRWVTVGPSHSPSPLSAEQCAGLVRMAAALERRCGLIGRA